MSSLSYHAEDECTQTSLTHTPHHMQEGGQENEGVGVQCLPLVIFKLYYTLEKEKIQKLYMSTHA